MIAAWRLPGARGDDRGAVGERALARKSAPTTGLRIAFDIRHADFRGDGRLATTSGSTWCLGSPPYFPKGTGIEGRSPAEGRLPIRACAATSATTPRVARAIWQRAACSPASFPKTSDRVDACSEGGGDRHRAAEAPWCSGEGEPPLVHALCDDADRTCLPSIRAEPGSSRRSSFEQPIGASGCAAVKLAVGFPPSRLSVGFHP